MKNEKCSKYNEETLLKWLHEGLDPNLTEQVKEHVEQCPACSAEVRALKKEEELIRGALALTTDNGDPSYTAGVLPERNNWSQRVKGRTGYWWLAIAASILLVLLGSQWRNATAPDASLPLVSVASMSAKPGETVLIPIRTENIEGRSGLEVKLKIDPSLVRVDKAEGSMAVCGVKENTITVVALSADGWRGQDGIAFRLPVLILDSVSSNTEIPVEFVSAEVVDAHKSKTKARTKAAKINVL